MRGVPKRWSSEKEVACRLPASTHGEMRIERVRLDNDRTRDFPLEGLASEIAALAFGQLCGRLPWLTCGQHSASFRPRFLPSVSCGRISCGFWRKLRSALSTHTLRLLLSSADVRVERGSMFVADRSRLHKRISCQTRLIVLRSKCPVFRIFSWSAARWGWAHLARAGVGFRVAFFGAAIVCAG